MSISGETFGELVRRTREAKDIGLREMAKMIGVTPTYLSKVERNEFAPSRDKVKAIAQIIGCDVDELLALAGLMTSETGGFYGLPQISVRAADHGDLRRDLASVLNRHSRENGSNTPDWILAQYLANCLDAYDVAIGARAQWYGRVDSIAGPLIVPRPIDTYTGADGKQHPIVEL